MCPATNCPNVSCQTGFIPEPNGCPTCQCSTCPPGSHAVSCPAVTCDLACPEGFVRDGNGCATCACRAAPTCAPPNVLCVTCRFGSRLGPNGCRTCACEEPPAGCIADGPLAP
jgi:hypothetical protein